VYNKLQKILFFGERRIFCMNKAELIEAMVSRTGHSKKATAESLNAFISVVSEALKANDKVQLVGFGTFDVRKRSARKGRNPQTKEEIKIPASKAPAFKAGKALKELVNK
jgi:DNA-binding protein HU-beta